jgi:hypothetical protein
LLGPESSWLRSLPGGSVVGHEPSSSGLQAAEMGCVRVGSFRSAGVAVVKALADSAAGVCLLLFLAATHGKLDSWRQWSRLSNEIPGPTVLRRGVRVIVPEVEGTVVVLSFAAPIVGLAAGAVVLAVFAVAVALLAQRLAGQECNCFGAIAPGTISQRLAVRNMAFAALAAGGWYTAHREDLQALSFSKVLVIVLFGIVALMLYQYRRLRESGRSASPNLQDVE